MFVGPVFTRELVVLPRRGRLFLARSVAVGALAALTVTAWQVLAGTQVVRNVGDFARFAATVFQLLAPLQLAAAVFFAAFSTAASVAQEKDRRTFDLLLLTNLNNRELVLGRLCASLLSVVNLVVAVVPFFAILALMGGIGFDRIGAVFVVTLAAVVWAGSLGSTIALWREKTFQILAVTALSLVAWTGFWEAAAGGLFGPTWGSTQPRDWAEMFSPWHAVTAAMGPFRNAGVTPFLGSSLWNFVAASAAMSLALNAVAVLRVRVWNPSRELTRRGVEGEAAATPQAWSLSAARRNIAEVGNVAVAARGLRTSRRVWDNPVLWRETMTWAYGRKVLIVRLAFAALCGGMLWGLLTVIEGPVTQGSLDLAAYLAPAAVLGAMLINLQAVTAVTAERDARAIDLLLVTDLTAKEFVFGKLAGVLYNAKEMLLLPLLMCGVLWWTGAAGGESVVYLSVGWIVAAGFVAMLGLHVGLHYVNSRTAVAVSAATVFFLVVGVAVSMRIMVAFSGSFQAQLQPFLATIAGGGIGLYAALGRRNPSAAITLASFLLPLATFYAITSFLLESTLAALLATVGAYGFATAALLVPAIFEFDIATGRTTDQDAGPETPRSSA